MDDNLQGFCCEIDTIRNTSMMRKRLPNLIRVTFIENYQEHLLFISSINRNFRKNVSILSEPGQLLHYWSETQKVSLNWIWNKNNDFPIKVIMMKKSFISLLACNFKNKWFHCNWVPLNLAEIFRLALQNTSEWLLLDVSIKQK